VSKVSAYRGGVSMKAKVSKDRLFVCF
jgi:hypothetical protein